jgi:hypothetical protein
MASHILDTLRNVLGGATLCVIGGVALTRVYHFALEAIGVTEDLDDE